MTETQNQSEVDALRARVDELEGQLERMRGRVNDGPSRRVVEEAEERYRLLVESHPEPIVIHDHGRLIYANPAALRYVGAQSADDLEGQSIFGLIHPRFRDLIAERSRLVQEEGLTLPLAQYELTRLDGEVRQVESIPVPVVHEGRRVVQAVLRDVTERKRAERVLKRYAERLEILHAIEKSILASRSASEVAETALVRAHSLVPFDTAALRLNDQRGTCFELTVVPHQARSPAFRFKKDACDEPLEERDLYRLPAGCKRTHSAALRVQNQLIGVLSVGTAKADPFTDEQQAFLDELAESLAVAVHSAQLFAELELASARQEKLAQRLVSVQEDERRQVAMELHDEIGQMLTALGLAIDMIEGATPDQVAEAANRARHITETMVQRVRDLSLNLRPALLDDLGLLPALVWYLQHYRDRTGVEVQFHHSGIRDRRFPDTIEIASYRIIQEALTNVARHAGVSCATVRLWTTKNALHLEVEDEGKGFSKAEALDSVGAAGISGMKERARMTNGTLRVEAAPEGGVRVTCTIPVFADEEAGV